MHWSVYGKWEAYKRPNALPIIDTTADFWQLFILTDKRDVAIFAKLPRQTPRGPFTSSKSNKKKQSEDQGQKLFFQS